MTCDEMKALNTKLIELKQQWNNQMQVAYNILENPTCGGDFAAEMKWAEITAQQIADINEQLKYRPSTSCQS